MINLNISPNFGLHLDEGGGGGGGGGLLLGGFFCVFDVQSVFFFYRNNFPALGTDRMFSRAWYRLHVFPRFATVTCFCLSSDWFIAFVAIGQM